MNFEIGELVEWHTDGTTVQAVIEKFVVSPIRFKKEIVNASVYFPYCFAKGVADGHVYLQSLTFLQKVSEVQESKPEIMTKPTKLFSPSLMSIGYSNFSLKGFVETLKSHGVSFIVDIRKYPRMSENPDFNKVSLAKRLKNDRIDYLYLEGLSGPRFDMPDIKREDGDHSSFWEYLSYMQTNEFEENLDEVLRISKDDNVALMCVNSDPKNCHRNLIADSLLLRNIWTFHIISSMQCHLHKLTQKAVVDGTTLSYSKDASWLNMDSSTGFYDSKRDN